ncbi:MAG: hypothetical protein OXC62_05730 [Aestuariivita sp.]|nr:hypothetical protein [Aestuariivita sp.]
MRTKEEKIGDPLDVALIKARELLANISTIVIDRPEVYPMQEGSITIDFRSLRSGKSGVFFVIQHDGSGALYHRTAKIPGRAIIEIFTSNF